MSADRRERARELFLDAIDADPAARRTLLDEECANDAELRREVESLLASHTSAGAGFLEPAGRREQARRAAQPDSWVGRRIGAYSIEGTIGSGGMGVVYLAQQQNPHRRVALKLVRAGLSEELRRRLSYEAEWLGRLQHPCVAQIFEAGTADTPEGPITFLAMEYVQGRDLATFIEQEDPSLHDRLTLFARLCDGVQHAHQRRIIHRDLKPPNVLVTDDGEPKILDFGIARPLEGDDLRTLETSEGQMLGTLPFMSPEQLLGDAVDTRTDVYSLGVLLYHMLAGRLPFQVSGMALPTAVNKICESEAPRLGKLVPELGGDVETIVAKALEKDPERRYPSAADLAADVRRHLNHEPITARPASTAYQLAKFTRRNRALVLSIGIAFVVLLGGLAGTSWGMWRARVARAAEAELGREEQRQREIAVAARAEAEQKERIAVSVRDLVQRLLTAPNPFDNPDFEGTEVRVVDVLANYDALVGESLAGEPEVEFEVLGLLAATYMSLGLHAEARATFERQRAVGETIHDPSAPALWSVDWRLAALAAQDFRFEDARAAFDALIERADADERQLCVMRRDRAHVIGMLGQPERAIGELEEVLAQQRTLLGPDDTDLLRTRRNLGSMLFQAGRPLEAEPHLREAAERLEATLGSRHPDTLLVRGDLAHALFELRRFEEAEKLMTAELEILEETVPAEHPRRLYAMSQLAGVWSGAGRYADAKRVLSELLEIEIRRYGESDVRTLDTAAALATNYHFLGEYDQARELYTLAATGFAAQLGEDHTQVLDVRLNLASLQIIRGELDQAVEALRAIAETFEERGESTHPIAMDARRQLAFARIRQGEHGEGAEMLVSVFEDLRAAYGLGSPRTLEMLDPLVRALEGAGDDGLALEILEDVVGELEGGDPRAFDLAGSALVDALERRGRADEAGDWRRRLGGG